MICDLMHCPGDSPEDKGEHVEFGCLCTTHNSLWKKWQDDYLKENKIPDIYKRRRMYVAFKQKMQPHVRVKAMGTGALQG